MPQFLCVPISLCINVVHQNISTCIHGAQTLGICATTSVCYVFVTEIFLVQKNETKPTKTFHFMILILISVQHERCWNFQNAVQNQFKVYILSDSYVPRKLREHCAAKMHPVLSFLGSKTNVRQRNRVFHTMQYGGTNGTSGVTQTMSRKVQRTFLEI